MTTGPLPEDSRRARPASREATVDDFLACPRLAVVGATDRAEKWGAKVFRYLRHRGHVVVPVNPGVESIDGVLCFRSLVEVPESDGPSATPVGGIVLIVNPRTGLEATRAGLARGVRRFLAQPGAESPEIEAACREVGASYVEACVLVEGPGRPPPGSPRA